MQNRRDPWYLQGAEPDYRFSLANERTFLAWIRTALAFLAVSLAIKQAVQVYGLDAKWARYAAICAAATMLLNAMAYRKWKRNEIAMRLGQPLPRSSILAALTLFIFAFGGSLVLSLAG